MRFSMFLVVAGLAWSQAFTDAAAVVAGSSVGVGAGKKMGQGITAALDSANGATAKAAKTDKVASVAAISPAKAMQKTNEGGGTVLKTGPGGVVKDHSLVPPPPPANKKVAVVPPPPSLAPPAPVVVTTPVLVLPPPPQATTEDLKTLASGTSKAEVLKLGAPSSRITMIDDGHLVEIFRYQTRQTTIGVVRLSDGSVSSVQVH
jgi:hypothetical protein